MSATATHVSPHNHPRRRKYRFKLYAFDEFAQFTPEEWEAECKINGTDLEPAAEEIALREGLKRTL